jgi:hypothetical protein
MYLGDRWEYLFRTEGDDFAIRAYGSAARCRALSSDLARQRPVDLP